MEIKVIDVTIMVSNADFINYLMKDKNNRKNDQSQFISLL